MSDFLKFAEISKTIETLFSLCSIGKRFVYATYQRFMDFRNNFRRVDPKLLR